MRHRHVLLVVAVAVGLGSVQSAAAQATFLQASPANNDFGSVAVGTSSSGQVFTISNTDPANSYTISGVSDGTPSVFPISGDGCTGATLGPQGSGTDTCQFTVTFKPAGTGLAQDTVDVQSTDPGGDLTIPVQGTGTGQPSVAIGGQSGYATAPGTSTQGNVTITNNGNVPLQVGNVTVTGAGSGSFSLAPQGANNTCSNQNVAPSGGTCTIQVTYAPTNPEGVTPTLTVQSNAPSSPDTEQLSGTADASEAQISPGSVGFGNVPAGQTSSSQTVTIRNTGVGTALDISTVSVVGDSAFSLSNNTCNGQSIAAGSQCTVDVTFSSTTAGSHTATLQVADDAGFGTPSPQQIALSANATVPGVSANRNPLAYPDTMAGKTSGAQTVTITNSGQAPLSISAVAIGGTNYKNFTITTQNCTTRSPIQPGGTCTVSATFRPTTTGIRNGDIVVTANLSTGHTYLVALTGTGTPPANLTGVKVAAGCTSAVVTWTPPKVGTPGYQRAWIVRNHGHVPASPTDGGVYFDTSRGTLNNTGLVEFTRYYYRVYAECSFVPGVDAYSSGVVLSTHTGWVCAPLNGGSTASTTPTITYLGYPHAVGYAVVLYHGASKLFTGFGKTTSIRITRTLTAHATYSVRVYGYTSARPNGFLLGTSTFTVS